MSRDHIVRSYGEKLRRLNALIIQMGGSAEAQVESAVRAVSRRDAELAGRVVRSDEQLNRYAHDVDAEALRILALHHPMAGDLREIVSAFKIGTDLKRIGGLAANIARRVMVITQQQPVRPAGTIPRMGRLVQEILKDVLDAYIRRDVGQAVAAWQRDEELDDLYTSLFRETLTYMMEDPRTITPCTHLLFIAKNLERVGDHATNIAETIHYLVEGRPLAAARPKSDSSSLTDVSRERDLLLEDQTLCVAEEA